MRIVFIGASKFGLRSLEAIMGHESFEVVGVVTAPQKFSISYNASGVTNVLYADFPEYCEAHNLPYQVISSGMKDPVLFEDVCSWKVDAFIVVGWYHMLPKAWLELAPAYGLHASLLPDYSGGAPLVWAMINGEKKTGISLFQFDTGVDNGPVVGQASTEINDTDTIATLYARIEELGINLLRDQLPLLAEGKAIFTIQDEMKRRVMPQRSPEDGLMDWSETAEFLDRFVRAQTKPYPGVFSFYKDQKIQIWSTTPMGMDKCIENAKIWHAPNGVVWIGCANGALILKHISLDGQDFYNEEISKVLEKGVFLAMEVANE